MKKIIVGFLYNRIEKLGDKDYKHVGFENDDNTFGDMIESIVPQIGMRKKAKLTVEIIEE